MSGQKTRDTGPELDLRRYLHRRGYRYRVDFAPLKVHPRLRADIVFTKHKIAVFVDGCFWHGCEVHGTWPKSNAEWWRAKFFKNRERDRRTNLLLEEAGWEVVRIWEHEKVEQAATKVIEVLG